MRKAEKETLLRYFLIAATCLLLLACFWLFFGHVVFQIKRLIRYIGVLLSPFLIAWLVAAVSRPFHRFLILRLHFRPSLAVLLTISLLLLLLLGLIFLLFLVLNGLFGLLIDKADLIDALLSRFSTGLNEIFVYVDLNILPVAQYVERFQAKLGDWGSRGLAMLFDIAKGTPAALIWLIVTLVAIFYWCRDEEKLLSRLYRFFPRHLRPGLEMYYETISGIFGGYIRAQSLLILIAAGTCALGMALCGVRNPLLMGLFAGVLDIIPVVGPGVVLIAWFFWAVFIQEYGMALGLAAVYVAVIISREILSPKLVGSGLGIHPLLALAGLFMGMKMFGLPGVILGPLVVAIVLMLLRKRRQLSSLREAVDRKVSNEIETRYL